MQLLDYGTFFAMMFRQTLYYRPYRGGSRNSVYFRKARAPAGSALSASYVQCCNVCGL